jgi:plastocyanin
MRTTTRLRTVALAAVVAVTLSACAGDDETDTADPDEPTAEAEPEPESEPEEADEQDAVEEDQQTPGEVVATDTVQVRNIAFEPADIEVGVGTTVTWVNEDIVNHTVTSGPAGDPDGRFDEPLASDGDEVTITFDEAGTFDYYCDLHRNMVGSVTVTDGD